MRGRMLNHEVFTEQAEYLDESYFEQWTIAHKDEASIIKKLTQGGAKLIKGPRGCGKTTLILKAYRKLILNKNRDVMPVYVNFKSSLKLEPLYKNDSNAAYWFNQWLLYKVLKGLSETLSKWGLEIDSLNSANLKKIIHLLEMGRVDLVDDKHDLIDVKYVEDSINEALSVTGSSRCVLLLDDAGHAFSTDQQHDFFEFFREIKTKNISPKAAIYPGVTSYSSSFHVGHDAEEIDVWIKPDSSGYMNFMHTILKSRFKDDLYEKLSKDANLLNLMCYAAFGIPRNLLNMISTFCNNESSSGDNSVTQLEHKLVLKEIKNNFDNTYQVFESLRYKLPMYSGFIETGASLYENCLAFIKEFNKKSDDSVKQSSTIAITRPLSSELKKVLGFFQYAGLIVPRGLSSRGDKGVYELYELHYGAIIDRNVFFSSRGISAEKYCNAFRNRPNHYYPRHAELSLLNVESLETAFALALPPCEVCKAPRVSDKARFCSNCGSKLKEASIFEDIVKQDIEFLPITSARARTIKSNSQIRTVKDVLMDHDNKELRSVPMIGPLWARRIKSYAEEYIA